jgi:hypothetical protein
VFLLFDLFFYQKMADDGSGSDAAWWKIRILNVNSTSGQGERMGYARQ